MKPTDPWAKLAAAYHFIGDQKALDKLVDQHPAAAAASAICTRPTTIGSGRSPNIAEPLPTRRPTPPCWTKLATAYQEAGRTREAVPVLASKLANDSNDTMLLSKVAALQAWFGQNAELAVTCTRALEFAKDTQDPMTARSYGQDLQPAAFR